jgi:hypothetical protein
MAFPLAGIKYEWSLVNTVWHHPNNFDFGRGNAVPLVKKVGGRRSPAFPLENITASRPTHRWDQIKGGYDLQQFFYKQEPCKGKDIIW